MSNENVLLLRVEDALLALVDEQSNRKIIARQIREYVNRFARRIVNSGDDDVDTTIEEVDHSTVVTGLGHIETVIDFSMKTVVSNEKLTVADIRRHLENAGDVIQLLNNEVRFVSHNCFAWVARCTVDPIAVFAFLAIETKKETPATAEDIISRQKRDLELEISKEERERASASVREFVNTRTRSRAAPAVAHGAARSLRKRVSSVAPIDRLTVRSKRNKKEQEPRTTRVIDPDTVTADRALSLIGRVWNWFVKDSQQQSDESTNYVAAYENDEELFIY